jgi:myo-inositol-1-phosphate synthase
VLSAISATDLKTVIVRMPPQLKRRLAQEVLRQGGGMNDVVLGILAERFGVPFTPSGRKGSPPGESGVVLLRMPVGLKRKLQAAASEHGSNANRTIVGALADHLGVRLEPPRSDQILRRRKEPMASRNGSTNGKTRGGDGKVRVAIVGVGNCANSLLQGVEYYKDAPVDQFVPGLMHVDLGGYHIRDIEFTAAFDVTADKVGKDLSDAIWAHPNDTIKFADVPKTGITVSRGMTHDGLGKYISEVVTKAPGETDDIVGILRDTKTDVVVNYLPVGSEAAAKWYAEQVLEAGCAMVNCMPVFIARENYWQNRFEEKGLPIIGDDIKSQVGATITHRVLTSLFRERGVHLDRTMQLNVGGNSDFLNMLERTRLESKKISKTNAVTSMLDYDMGAENVHVGPSDYVPWLTDRKWAFIRLEGTSFGDVPLNIELKLEVWDSPNSAGIVIDAVRMAKLALNNGVAGALEGPSSYLMKSPPKQIVDDEAYEATEAFIKQYARKPVKAPATA